MSGLGKHYETFFIFDGNVKIPVFLTNIDWSNLYHSFLELIQFMLLKRSSQISVHILLKWPVLSCCKNKPISSGETFLIDRIWQIFLTFLFGWSSGRYHAGFNTVEQRRRICIRSKEFLDISSKEFLDIQATIECGFTLKRVRDMTRTYS